MKNHKRVITYIHKNGEPIACSDQKRFNDFCSEEKNMQIRYNVINIGKINVTLSTVFLGVDLAYRNYRPILWETMIFSDLKEIDLARWNYDSQEIAIKNHEFLLKKITKCTSKKELISLFGN